MVNKSKLTLEHFNGLLNFNFTKDKTIIDIGVHIGCFSLIAGKNNARLFSYEPDPESFKLLKKNISSPLESWKF